MPSYTRSMASSNTIFEGEPAQPDYATKPVTALRNVMLKAISFVNKGANGKRFFLFKNEEGTGTIEDDNLVEYSALIKKHNPFGKDWEVAYCVIAEPNEVDKQRDIWEQDEIEKACNSFIEEGGLLNFMHEDMKKVGTLAQNALALEDIRITTTDGTVETIKKGSWYIGVKPNPEVKKMIDMGEITGMSVQGSAQREVVAKAAKDNGAIPMGTEGPGVIKLQNILGVEETGVYDQVTHDQVIAWMDEKGAPGVPSFATIKAILAGEPKPAAPVAPMAPAAEAPVMPGVEKDQEGYIPTDQNAPTDHPQERNGTILGSGPGNVGVDRSNVTVESPDEDLKALIAEAINEENEGLLQYLDSRYRVSSANSLYSVQIPREELWFMVSKFILGTEKKVLNESGDMVAEGEVSEPGVEKDEDPAPAAPSGEIKAGDVVVHNGKGSVVEAVEGDMVVLLAMTKGGTEKKTKVPMSEVTLVGAKAVEKSSAGGSMGGHDPRKNGKIRFIVRSFGSWAGGLHRVCVARLKTEHPEVFKGNENAGCFLAGTKIETLQRGLVNVEDIAPFDAETGEGDWVKTHSGYFRPVLGTRANQAGSRRAVSIFSELNESPLRVTNDHPVLVARGAEFWPGTRTRKRSKTVLAKVGIESPVRSSTSTSYPKQTIGQVEEAWADTIMEHDYLLYPTNRIVQDTERSDDYLWLLGMFAAEGTGVSTHTRAGAKNENARVGWYFDKNEDISFECKERAEREFGYKFQIVHTPTSDFVTLDKNQKGANREIKEKLRLGLSGNCWTKRFSPWVLALPEDRLRIVLEAYWSGDGHVRQNRRENVATTVSQDLAYQIRQMLMYLGERPSVRQSRDHRDDVIEGRVVKGSPTWTVSYNPSKTRRTLIGNENFIAFPITKIEVSEAPEWVYTLHVAEDNTLIADGVAAFQCAWLKDQWAGTTKWRHGGGKLGKAAVAVEKALSSVNKSEALHEMLEKAEPEVIDAMFKQMCTDMGVDADEVMQKMDSEEFDAYLEKMFDTEDTAEAAEAPEGTEVEKAPDSPSDKVAGILRGDQPSEEKIAQIKEAISNKANGDVLDALKDAIEEVSKLPDDERKTGIEEIVEDFTSYIERKSQVSKSFSSGKLEENKTTDTFLNRGEEMDNINKEEQDRLVEAASYITSYFGGQADAATEVEKDAVAVEEEAVEETADEAPAAVDAPDETEAPEAEGPEAELDDENEAVSEEELVAVMNHMMQEVDRLSDRVGQLENLEKKLDQVGELAKALDVTDQLDSQGDTVSGLVKQLGEMSDAFETLKKRLEVVATTPGAPSALSVDEVEVVETVAKSAGNAGDPKSIWASSPISPV